MTERTPLILNFGHPLTETHLEQCAALLGQRPDVRDLSSQTDRQRPLADVAHNLANQVALSSVEWQTVPLVVNPPGLAPLALALAAELHGRCGYFLPILHMRPVPDALPPRYEVAEIVNIQALREAARTRRETKHAPRDDMKR
jgi:hypothetical protein